MQKTELRVMQIIDGQSEKRNEKNVRNVSDILSVKVLGKSIQRYMDGRNLYQ